MARFRQFTKRQLWQRFLVQKVPTFYMIVDKIIIYIYVLRMHDASTR
jgi:hypothetical protein